MASLKRIEELRIHLETENLTTDPQWILGMQTDPPSEVGHISGQLRETSDAIWDNDGLTVDELNSISVLLSEAAERLDDAHQEWMEAKYENLLDVM